MNKFLSLTKIQLKEFWSRYQSGLGLKKGKLESILVIVLFALLMIPSFPLSSSLFKTFLQINHPELTITSMYISAVFMAFFIGISFIVSTFFYASDIKFLISLPIKEESIIFAKLSSIYVYLLGITSLVFVPTIVIYGINISFSISLIIFGLIAILLVPILPMLISALIILPVMKFISGSKYRNLLSILAGLILIVLLVAMQFVVIRQESNPEFIQQIFMQEDGLLRYLGLRFPPSVWLTKMILGSFKDAVFFIGLNLAFLVLLRSLAKVFYKKAILNFNQETGSKTGKIYYKKRSKGYQLLRRNLLVIFKQPTFFLNTMLSLFIPVLIFVIMMFSGEVSLDFFNSPKISPYLVFIFGGILVSPAIVANLSATAITREGKCFWETKVLPISIKDNIRYRILTTIVLNLLSSVILGILSSFIMPLTAKIVTLGTLLCISVTLLMATLDIFINIHRPLLDWTNPTAAVKNNLNVMLSMVVRFIFIFALYQLYKILPKINPESFTILLIGFSFVLYLISRYLLNKYYIERFNKIFV